MKKRIGIVLGLDALIISLILGGYGTTVDSGSTTSEINADSAFKESTITIRTIEFLPIYFKDKSTDEINKAFQNKTAPITKLQMAEAQPVQFLLISTTSSATKCMRT
jgi:FlaG/FlaF family flagellin (archaellin)